MKPAAKIPRAEALNIVRDYLYSCATALRVQPNHELRSGLHDLMVDAAQQGVSLVDFREFVIEDYSA